MYGLFDIFQTAPRPTSRTLPSLHAEAGPAQGVSSPSGCGFHRAPRRQRTMIGRSCGSDHRIHVFVHADTHLARMGIRGLLAGVENLDVTELGTESTPSVTDVLIWAVGTAEAASLTPARDIRLPFPRVVLLLERSDTRPTVGRLCGATRGVLFSDCERDQLVRAIEAVSRGDYYLTADLEPSLTPAPSPERSSVVAALTEREHQVARRLAEGLSNKKISTEMHVSLATVKFHVSNILRKLGVQTRAQAVAVLSRQFMHLEDPAPSRRHAVHVLPPVTATASPTAR